MFLVSHPRALGPKTEHESFFEVADLVYAAGDLRETKKASPNIANNRVAFPLGFFK